MDIFRTLAGWNLTWIQEIGLLALLSFYISIPCLVIAFLIGLIKNDWAFFRVSGIALVVSLILAFTLSNLS